MTTRTEYAQTGYNGWSNYETWCVNLWLSNEESSQRQWTGRARELATETGAPIRLADELKTWVTEEAPELKPSLYSDLLMAALGSVNWLEIARELLV